MATRNPMNDRYVGDGPQGKTRKSAASAKPKRKAADTVYVKSAGTSKGKPVKEKTKEEKRVEREQARVENNAIYSVATVLMNNDPTYKKFKSVWWGLLGFAIVATIVSWILQFQKMGSQTAAIVTVVIAYVGIVGALILDFWKIRPIRKSSREAAANMSKKQLDAVLEKEVLKNQRKKLEKEMKKVAKEGTATPEEQKEKLEKIESAQEKADERADRAFGVTREEDDSKPKRQEEPKRDMSRINSYRRGSGK